MKPIPDHDGYFADELGNIYSNKGKGGSFRKLKLSPISKKNKHLRVMFSGDRRYYRVHRVIYRTFIGEIPEGKVICHKDDDPNNNRLSNLYAGTHSENVRDAAVNGKKLKGEQIRNSKLKEYDVIEILSLFGKMRNVDIANMFGVDKSTITDIFKNRTWKHIEREKIKL